MMCDELVGLIICVVVVDEVVVVEFDDWFCICLVFGIVGFCGEFGVGSNWMNWVFVV